VQELRPSTRQETGAESSQPGRVLAGEREEHGAEHRAAVAVLSLAMLDY